MALSVCASLVSKTGSSGGSSDSKCRLFAVPALVLLVLVLLALVLLALVLPALVLLVLVWLSLFFFVSSASLSAIVVWDE